MTHGGKRAGAGKPRTQLDERRVLVLMAQKVSQREIAERFGVTLGVIKYFARRQAAIKAADSVNN